MTRNTLFSVETSKLLLFTLSSISLLFAFNAQYFLNISACLLCQYQRFIYWLLLVSCTFFFKKDKLFFYSGFVLTFLGLILSFFHFGLEQQWWRLPGLCIASSMTLSDLPSNDCSNVSWTFLGISMVFWILVVQLLTLLYLSISWVKHMGK
ncbi:MAG TPA: disulfide bond formation protein B [Alphaproteobacteria bacterium]|nr:disulfide bond formation protein B [Alphaproteobacteria bacterium]